MPTHHLCVFCGSNPGRDPAYVAAARTLAEALVEADCGLVYGGGSRGMMGAVADAVLALGGRAVGIVPDGLFDAEHVHDGLSELVVVKNLAERKARMTALSDGFVVLPGGLGTLDELFEMWVSAQLGIERLPLGLLNTRGYFTPLLEFLDRCVEEEFVRSAHRAMLVCAEEPRVLVERLLPR